MSGTPDDLDSAQRKLLSDAHVDIALQTMKDVAFRFDEAGHEHYGLYDLLNFLVEDLVREGCCAVCIKEAVDAALTASGADLTEHVQDDKAVFH